MTIGVCGLLAGLACAQQGDRPGEPQTAPPAHWRIPPAPVLSPDEALKTFRLADDFLTIELFASEPMVQDPVAMDFDADGRLWVVEMRGFMPDIDGRGENEPVGRVSILEDTNGDGRADKATVFLDKLVLPRAIKVCWGGALVAHDEKLWFAKDTNGDDVADEHELVDEDYIQSGNLEHQPNGLLLALDNWIYSAKSDQRYRRVGGKWLKEQTEFRGQWGITQDDFGRLYYNVNYSQLHADLFPPNYSLRNTNFIPVHAINQRIATDQRIFTLRPNTGVNRAYRPGILDERGHLKEFTSACAPLVYRDITLIGSEALGKSFSVFVCEPAANLVKRNVVWHFKAGASSEFAYPDREFLASTDERFRPVWLATSPDGGLYIADMYRGINQHRQYMTSYLRGEILSRGLDQGVNHGRIWRVRNRNAALRSVEPLVGVGPEAWLKALSSVNGSRRDHAQQLVVEQGDASLIPALLQLAKESRETFDRMHALWAIEGLLVHWEGDAVAYRRPEADVWASLLGLVAQDIVAGASAVRIAALIAGGKPALEDQLLDLIEAEMERGAPFPWFHGALVLGDLPGDRVLNLMVENLDRGMGSPVLHEAVMSGLGGRELSVLQALIKRWTHYERNRDVVLQTLAACIAHVGNGLALVQVLTLAADQDEATAWRQLPLLNGLLENRLALRRNPIELPAEPAALVSLRQSDDPVIRSAAETIATFVEWPGHQVERPPVVRLRPLTGAFAQQFAEGRALYQQACAACHGLAGEGLPNLAPPLVDSEWVTGPEDRLIRIVLHGMEGPIEVNGRRYEPPAILPNMPAVDSLTDTELAALLGYVTREMGMIDRPVSAQDVAVIRHRFADRATPWTAAELNGAP
jgi:mono/diheme cytochrome c family protein